MGTRFGKGTILSGDAEEDSVFIVKEFAVDADDILHFLIHVVNAAEALQTVAFGLRHIVFYPHLVKLRNNLVDSVVDTDVEQVLTDLGRLLCLANLNDDQADRSDGENSGQ